MLLLAAVTLASSAATLELDYPPAVERLIALRTARQLEAAGQVPEALALLVPHARGDDPLAIAIQFHAARLRLLIGEEAHPALESLLRGASGPTVRWGIDRREEAEALQMLARRLGAPGQEIRRRAALDYPRWIPAPANLTRKERLARARNLIRDMDYHAGLTALEALLAGAEASEAPKLEREIGYLIGSRMRNDYARAQAIFQKLASQPEATADDLLYLAYVTGKLDPSAAIKVYEELAERFPEHEDVDEARFFVAWTAFDLERLDEATRGLSRFLRRHPDSGFKYSARWHRGLARFRLGRYAAALADFSYTARLTSQRQKGTYWSARALRELGHRRRANDLFYELAETAPFSYYGLLARALLPERRQPPVYDSGGRARNPGLSDAQARAALERLAPHTRGLLCEAFAAEQIGWPGLAHALLDYTQAHGLRADRYADLRYWLQRRLGAAHVYVRSGESRRCRRALDKNPRRPAVAACWRKAYPMPFARQIDRVRGTLPASLFWSIMRQESFYSPNARSHADALGLMQVIPQVGRPAAEELGRAFAPYDLYEPDTNLEIFALAARERANAFNNHVPLILMSYNATPGKARYWLRDNQDLPFDLFVEEIPWSETRRYVKRISTHLARYETLLGERQSELHERAGLPHPETIAAQAFPGVLGTELAAAD